MREAIIARIGSLEKLRVPGRNEDLPQPALPDGSIDPRFKITEARRYLGKLLYFDPVRMNRIRPEFGGDFSTIRTASCGSCHLGEVAGKAGQIVNLAQGAEGRGYTDSQGRFHVRRRVAPGKVDIIFVRIHQLKLTNSSDEAVDTHLRLCFKGLPLGAVVLSAEGRTIGHPSPGLPYQRIFLPNGVLEPGKTVSASITIYTGSRLPLKLNMDVLSGQGRP